MGVSVGPAIFESFLRRVHRRQVILRMLEGAGLGILGECAAALPLIGVELWRGMPTTGIALAGLAIGATAGVLWGILTRPPIILSAIEADRQLGWDDLLSSALSVSSAVGGDPWALALQASADSRCNRVSPSTLVLHRFGARAWGGIGLATALVLALGLIPTFVSPTRAEDPQALNRNALAALAGEGPQASGTSDPSRRTAAQQEPEDADPSRFGGRNPEDGGQTKPIGIADSTSEKEHISKDPSGSGAGAAQSKTANPAARLSSSVGTQAGDDSKNARPAGGAGRAASQRSGTGQVSGQNAGGTEAANKAVPPWQSSQWPADSQRANAAIESGRIPDSYRDIIRGYFQQP